MPDFFSSTEAQGKQSSTLRRNEDPPSYPVPIDHDYFLRASNIRYRDVRITVISGHAPLNSAHGSAFTYAHLPQYLPFMVRVQAIHHSGLLARYQDPMSTWQRNEDR